MRQTACLVVNPITVNNFAFPFLLYAAGGASDFMKVPTSLIFLMKLVCRLKKPLIENVKSPVLCYCPF